MRRHRLIAVLTLLVVAGGPTPVLACSCSWRGPFTKVALGNELVVLGAVVSHYRNSMTVRVLDVIKGAETRAMVRIWGDNGALCRPYVTSFPVGTRWLLALAPLPEQPPGDPSFREGFSSAPGNRQYAISICGDFWLEVRGDRAMGRITLTEHSNRRESVLLQDMVAWLRSNGQAPPLSPTPLESGH